MAQEKPADVIRFSPGTGEAGAQNDTAGARLAAARAAAGLTVEGVSAAIKVKIEHLEAIEAMRPDRLPALPFATGFVKTYARHLGLDAEEIAARFRADIGAAQPVSLEAAREVRAAPPPDNGPGEGARMASIAIFIAVTLFFLWIAFQIAGAGRSAPEAEPVATAAPAAAPAPSAEPAPRPVILPEGPEVSPAPNPALFGEPETTPPAEPEDTQAAPPSAAAPAREEATPAPPPVRPQAPEPRAAEAPAPREPVAQPDIRAPQPRVDEPPRPLPRRARPAPRPVIVEAELTRSSAPAYPERCARGAAAVESVTVRFDVSASGRAVNARVVSSTDDCFEAEALSALSRWRFSPRTVDGAPAVEEGKTATLKFAQ